MTEKNESEQRAEAREVWGNVNALVELELVRATKKFGPFASAHEGYAVIKEELEELWDEIKSGQDKFRMRDEATQVAAMAMRFLIDCCFDVL